MVRYTVDIEELFFLCIYSGAEVLFGLNNPLEGLERQKAEVKWDGISKQLKEKQILIPTNEEHQLYITQDYAAFVEVLSFPEHVFTCLVEADDVATAKLVFYRAESLVFLKEQEGKCEIQYCSWEEGIPQLRRQLLLSECGTEAELYLPTDEANYALSLAGAGERGLAELLLQKNGVERGIAAEIIDAFGNGADTQVIAGFDLGLDSGMIGEALYTCVKSNEGTWMLEMRPEQEQVFLFKRKMEAVLDHLFHSRLG